MTREEAISVIKHNWPSEHYTMLREALEFFMKSPWKSLKDEKPKDGQLIAYAYKDGEFYMYGTIYYPEPPLTNQMDYWMPIEEIQESLDEKIKIIGDRYKGIDADEYVRSIRETED